MSLVRWSDEYSVCIKEIDEQHKQLFDLINKLHDAMKETKANNILGKVIKDLVSYTKYHFSSEEILLKNCNYPNFEQHKLLHDEFFKRIKEIEEKYFNDSVSLSQEVLQYLIDWLVYHIKNTDKQYSMFIINANVA
jgi:hemerythrin